MKKIFSLLAVFILIMSFAGCGDDNSTQNNSQEKTASVEKKNDEDPNATADQKNAVKKAREKVETMHMSKTGIAKELVELNKFSEADAEYAVSKLTDVNWKEIALKSAENHANLGMAKSQLSHQLQYEGFTQEEAEYAVANIKADFKEIAAKKAKRYQEEQHMSIEGIRQQLLGQLEGFTEEEVEYAISKLQK